MYTYLSSTELQFGFKHDRSTAMCTMILKEVVSFYVKNNSNIRCIFLDATKAFDRVEYGKLFRLLMARAVPRHIIRLLLNMYIGQQARVSWNGIFSDTFRVLNGVKQGGIISPVLFCIYFDVLLTRLSEANTGCHLGQWFVGALAYADDIVILAPTANAARRMLDTCDVFASEYCVQFNASKSKCIHFHTGKSSRSTQVNTEFSIGGNKIENVSSWKHLGHIISSDCDDSKDIQSRCRTLSGQINNVVCSFSTLDSITKNRLFASYCSSFYGCELWDLSNKELEKFCITWRKGARRIWTLPPDAHSDLVYYITNSPPIFDELCRRVYNFVNSCLNCSSNLVRSVVMRGIAFERCGSPVGRNAAFCGQRFRYEARDRQSGKLRQSSLRGRFLSGLSDDVLRRASCLMEALSVRDGALHAQGYSRRDI